MKKFCIYLLCGMLTCSVLSSAYYRSAHAMEWVGGALAFEEALKWCLALLGITATAGMTNEYWENYGDDFTEYAIENGATQQEVTEWQMKLCEGILDKGSAVWNKFKTWASSLVSGSSVSVPAVGASYDEVMDYLNSLGIYTWTKNSNYNSSSIYAVFISKSLITGSIYLYLFTSNKSYTANNSNNPSGSYIYCQNSNSWTSSYGTTYINTSSSTYYYISRNISVSSSTSNWEYFDFGDSSSVSDQNFESAFTSDIDNADVISSVLPDEDDAEVSLPYPGVSDGDNTASADAYDDIIDAINDGTITQEQGIEKIQELLKVIVYDDVTDDILPNKPDDDTGENKKKDDAINENKNNMGFSLAGLENVFPFCIPFDIYAFMTILVAEPVAPELDYPIQNVNGEVEEIHIDLSPFEPVAVVVRYVFDFLFIIGLGLLTRSLIGGGSSD